MFLFTLALHLAGLAQGQTLTFSLASIDSTAIPGPERTRVSEGRNGELGRSADRAGIDWSRQSLRRMPYRLDTLNWRPSVNLSNNNIRRLPERVSYLHTDSLNLSSNRLGKRWTNWSDVHIPRRYSLPRQLEYLNVSGNRFKRFSLHWTRHVTHVDASWNYIEELIGTWGFNQTLEVLNLEGNALTSFPQGIGGCVALVELDLSDNGMRSMSYPINRLDQLQVLDLSNNDLHKVHRSVRRLYNLKTLDLRGNPLEEKEIEKLRKMLPTNCELLVD